MSKRLGGIKGCKYKTSSWHLNGFPDRNNIIGSTVQYRGEAFVVVAEMGTGTRMGTGRAEERRRSARSRTRAAVVDAKWEKGEERGENMKKKGLVQ